LINKTGHNSKQNEKIASNTKNFPKI